MARRKTLPYHRAYQSDFLQGCSSLTLEEKGAYRTIIDLIYDAGGPIENNERWLAGWMNATPRMVRKMVSSLLSKQKIYLTYGGRISNRRCERELEETERNAKRQSERASTGVRSARKSAMDPYGLADEKLPKTEKKREEIELFHRPNFEKNSEYVNENNQPVQPDQSRDEAIPDPEPYNNSSTVVAEDTRGRDPVVSSSGEIITMTSVNRLLNGLTGKGEGKYQLQSYLDRTRRRRGGD